MVPEAGLERSEHGTFPYEHGWFVVNSRDAQRPQGQERLLRQWDFVHCPPWTEHVFVAAGDGPCLILMVGARRSGRGLRYPVNEVARRHGAGVDEETTDPKEAYARFGGSPWSVACPDEFPAS